MDNNKLDFSDYMRICIDIAKSNSEEGKYAIGAIVVDGNGQVISDNDFLALECDPTAHPEIIAIRSAAQKINNKYLKNCYLITTLEPCPMCTAAAIWAKMRGIVYGVSQEEAIKYSSNNPQSKFAWRQITIPSKVIINNGNPYLELHPGVLHEECIRLFSLVK